MSGLVLYSKSGCQRCVELKKLLEQKGIIFSEVNLDDPIAKQTFISTYQHVKSLPFVAGNYVHFR